MTEHQREPNPNLIANREAERALQAVIQRMGSLHERLAMISTLASRPNVDRPAVLAACAGLAADAAETRAEVLSALADAETIRGHSRVVDVEKALKGIEAKIDDVRNKLAG